MIPYVTIQALSDDEIGKIHSAMVSILSRTGLTVEHEAIHEASAGYGARVGHDAQRVWFPEGVIDRFLDETQPIDYSPGKPSIPDRSGVSFSLDECYRPLCPGGGRPTLSVRSGVSFSTYLEPGTNRPVPFTEQTLAGYIKLARLLDNGIQMTNLCPYLLEMYEIRADALGQSLSEVFCGSLYVISPLRIPRDVCEQIVYFHERGLKACIGNLFTMGGTGPVTLAGCLALNLAERVAIGILERVLYGDKQWVIYGEVAPLDMSTLIMLKGPPRYC